MICKLYDEAERVISDTVQTNAKLLTHELKVDIEADNDRIAQIESAVVMLQVYAEHFVGTDDNQEPETALALNQSNVGGLLSKYTSIITGFHCCIHDFVRQLLERLHRGINEEFDVLAELLPRMKLFEPLLKSILDYSKRNSIADIVQQFNGHEKFIAYSKLVKHINIVVRNSKSELLQIQLFLPQSNAVHDNDIQQQYNHINKLHSRLHKDRIQCLNEVLDPDIRADRVDDDVQSCIRKSVNTVVNSQTKIMATTDAVSESAYDTYNHIRKCFHAMLQCDLLKPVVQQSASSFDEIITDQRLKRLENSVPARKCEPEQLATALIEIKRIAVNVPVFRDVLSSKIDDMVDRYKSCSPNFIEQLGTVLIQDVSGVGHDVLQSHSAFEGFRTKAYNTLTGQQKPENVIDGMKPIADSIMEKEQLQSSWAEFDTLYKKLVQQHLNKDCMVTALVMNAKSCVKTYVTNKNFAPKVPDGLSFKRIVAPGNCLIESIAFSCGMPSVELRKKLIKYLQFNDQGFYQYIATPYLTQLIKAIQDTSSQHPIIKHDSAHIVFISHAIDRPIVCIDWRGNKILGDSSLFGSKAPILVLRTNDTHFDAIMVDQGYQAGSIIDSMPYAGWISNRQQKQKHWFTAEVKYSLPSLVANVFAAWTVLNCKPYFEANNKDKSYLRQPHPAQVLSIFRLLGISCENNEFANNIVQIGTGEGKSVVLAVLAIVLSLLGFRVDVACYSSYLSSRDRNAFIELFDQFGVSNQIQYGTFNVLCEAFINRQCNVRQTVQQMLERNSDIPITSSIQGTLSPQLPAILLIDEVDVFFSKQFYGNMYRPSVKLHDPLVKQVVDEIWNRHKNKEITFQQVQNTVQYNNLISKYNQWTKLIDEAIHDMLSAIVTYKSHQHEIKDDKIKYKDQDTLTDKISYGYQTLFAYYDANEKRLITDVSLQENVGLIVKCGSYSYSEMPYEYQYILGVSGTLEVLGPVQQNIIKNVYQIHRQNVTPSVYGEKTSFRWAEDRDITITNSNDYHNVIMQRIETMLQGTVENAKRAVVVFFESTIKLKQFVESLSATNLPVGWLQLDEETNANDKDKYVNRATTSGQVTLCTREYGRGTDFVCRDQRVKNGGGVHVIQTFLSAELSEEKQIQGRTARQSDSGSYEMILLDSELEQYGITAAHVSDMKRMSAYYTVLNEHRNAVFASTYDDGARLLNVLRREHDLSLRFMTSLLQCDADMINQLLMEQNKSDRSYCKSSCRIMVLMDGTGSMSLLLNKAKMTVGTMFERATNILHLNPTSKGYDDKSFSLQFVTYRNYNCTADMLLQYSAWEHQSTNLVEFMSTVTAQGGWGNEAIEIGLYHAVREHKAKPITSILLIGDAPANTETDIAEKRHASSMDWGSTEFSNVTHYQEQLNQLIQHKIPIHTFYLNSTAEKCFGSIALQTGGTCDELDVNSSDAADKLTNLVTEEILRRVGGSDGTRLVQQYRDMYVRTYSS